MGLAAVVFGALWRDAHLPIVLAAGVAVLLGSSGRRTKRVTDHAAGLPPLIVTLGTFSLFRGIAEGLTRGIENYSGFSPRFLFLRSGLCWWTNTNSACCSRLSPLLGFGWWLHRTAFGRSLYAIGYSAEGARYAGIAVSRKLFLVYLLSGLAASVSAIIYVAHLGQAKSDAGTGFELMAITAVVLGGASIFGGRGTVLGTVLGLFAIVVLQNGLRLESSAC